MPSHRYCYAYAKWPSEFVMRNSLTSCEALSIKKCEKEGSWGMPGANTAKNVYKYKEENLSPSPQCKL